MLPAGDGARAVQHAAAVGADIDDVGLVGRADQGGTVEGAEALVALEVDPGGPEIGAGVELLAVGAPAEDVEVPAGGTVAVALADGDGVGVDGALGDGGEGLAGVGAAEDARVGRDEELAGVGGMRGDAADVGDVGEAGLGKGGGAVGREVEDGLGGRVQDLVVPLVAGDDAARGQGGDGLGVPAVADGQDAGAAEGRPEDDVAVGRVGDGAVGGDGGVRVRPGRVQDGPGGAAVAAEGELGGVGGLADADDLGGVVAGEVDRDAARPPGVRPGGAGRLAEVGDGGVGEAVVVEGRHQQLGAAGGAGEAGDGHLLDARGQAGDGDALVAVPVGQVVAAEDGEAGAVEPPVAVGGIDLEGLDHPAELLGVDVEEVGLDPGGLRMSCGAGVGGAEEDGVRVPAVEGGDHESPGLLHVDAQAAEAVKEIGARGRGDVGPRARGEVVLVDAAAGAVVGAGAVRVGEVDDLLGRLQSGLVREELGRLVGDGAPGRAGVVADVDRGGGVVGGPDEDSRGGAVDDLGRLVKGDKRQALSISPVSVLYVFCLAPSRARQKLSRSEVKTHLEIAVVGIRLRAGAESPHGLERSDLMERSAWRESVNTIIQCIFQVQIRRRRGPELDGCLLTAIRALPQAIAAASTKVENLRVLGVDSKPLAHSAAGHVAADLEGQRGELPSLALVGAAGDGAISRRDVYFGRVGRVEGQGVDSPVAPAGVAREAVGVGHGGPRIVGVEAVEAADVGAGVGDARLGRVEGDARDEAASSSGVDVLPRACGPDGCRGRQEQADVPHGGREREAAVSLEDSQEWENRRGTGQMEEMAVSKERMSSNEANGSGKKREYNYLFIGSGQRVWN
ncbi:hypothetical protein CTA1_2369 [Colletotrichum tanaceti]|uniref:Uncharacterized protein n=1 Tax=Colletotrichum tanaceti TaxID=1306861 RepID=A0A4U6XGZ8_9PEZI|nr:hypothetical protein CTA1_2369 [Colletotrichum tanaceti]